MTVPTAPTARLSALGLELPQVAAPLAAYVPAVVSGSQVLTSGQLPLVDGALPLTGKVGAEISPEQGQELARTAVLNALAAASAQAGGLDRIVAVVKLTGFVASAPDFTGQPGVIDGASALLGEVFGDAGAHARSAVGVAVLPKDAPVEIELVVEIA